MQVHMQFNKIYEWKLMSWIYNITDASVMMVIDHASVIWALCFLIALLMSYAFIVAIQGGTYRNMVKLMDHLNKGLFLSPFFDLIHDF